MAIFDEQDFGTLIELVQLLPTPRRHCDIPAESVRIRQNYKKIARKPEEKRLVICADYTKRDIGSDFPFAFVITQHQRRVAK
jgi:hypothetical protein